MVPRSTRVHGPQQSCSCLRFMVEPEFLHVVLAIQSMNSNPKLPRKGEFGCYTSSTGTTLLEFPPAASLANRADKLSCFNSMP